ncbi:MAG: amidohydrolase family protein [Gammaproteobacteria bacterium]
MSKGVALRTAIIDPARLFGIANRTGLIGVGKETDLLFVKEN